MKKVILWVRTKMANVNRGKSLYIVILMLFTHSTAAELVSQTNVTINRLGSHDGNVFFMNLVEGFIRPCAFSSVYCSTSNPDCKAKYATVLSAKLVNKKLSRIDYNYDTANNVCEIWLVEIN